MKIIGHRGARGTELENSLAAIQKALEFNIDAVEFDIHRTKDDVLVVMHDATTRRTGESAVRIADVSFAELQQIRLQNGQVIPTLDDVLSLIGDREVYIDVKDTGTAPLLLESLRKYSELKVTVVSWLGSELKVIREAQPDIPTYLYFLKAKTIVPRPIHMVTAAKKAGATGLGLDKLILNPLTYLLAKRKGFKLYCYPLKSRWGTRLLLRFYPSIDLMTSRPEKINHDTFPSPL